MPDTDVFISLSANTIFVADAAEIVCGAKFQHMPSNFSPHDKIVMWRNCIMWINDKLLHLCNVEYSWHCSTRQTYDVCCLVALLMPYYFHYIHLVTFVEQKLTQKSCLWSKDKDNVCLSIYDSTSYFNPRLGQQVIGVFTQTDQTRWRLQWRWKVWKVQWWGRVEQNWLLFKQNLKRIILDPY